MSFLEEIESRKNKLKHTTTLITRPDGSSYVESTETRKCGLDPKKLDVPMKSGFVIDYKPDKIPAEVISGLFIGSQDCTDMEILEKFQITHILSVGINIPVEKKQQYFIACLDLSETNIIPVLEKSIAFINRAFNENGKILVHCNAGVSRSSMVLIGFLILEKSYNFLDAYNLLKVKRSSIQPNAGFLKQLKEL